MAKPKPNKGGRPSKFTEEDRLSMLADRAQGMTLTQIGEKHGVSHGTIVYQLDELEGKIAERAPFVAKYLDALQVILGDKIKIALDGITESKAAEANISALATAANLLNSMRRLESGQATSASEVKYSRINIDDYKNPTKIVEVKEVQAVSSTEQTPIARDNAHESVVPVVQEKEPQ